MFAIQIPTVPVCVHLIKFPLDPFFLVIRDPSFWNGSSVQGSIFTHDQFGHVRVKLGSIRLGAGCNKSKQTSMVNTCHHPSFSKIKIK